MLERKRENAGEEERMKNVDILLYWSKLHNNVINIMEGDKIYIVSE